MNKRRGSASIHLDKVRTFRYNLNAMAILEDEGLDIQTFAQKAKNNTLKSKELRFFIWAGLMHEDSDLTVDIIGSLIDFDNLTEIIQAIEDSLSSLLSAANDNGTKKKKKK